MSTILPSEQIPFHWLEALEEEACSVKEVLEHVVPMRIFAICELPEEGRLSMLGEVFFEGPNHEGCLWRVSLKESSTDQLSFDIEEEMKMDNQKLAMQIYLGDVTLSLEEYADLAPGVQLQFERPQQWDIIVKLGELSIARGHLEVGEEQCGIVIDSYIVPELKGKLLRELAEVKV